VWSNSFLLKGFGSYKVLPRPAFGTRGGALLPGMVDGSFFRPQELVGSVKLAMPSCLAVRESVVDVAPQFGRRVFDAHRVTGAPVHGSASVTRAVVFADVII